MFVSKNEKDSNESSLTNRWLNRWPLIRKTITTTAVITLLLPNLITVGVIAAEELPADEPAVEEVEQLEEAPVEAEAPEAAETEEVEMEEPTEVEAEVDEPAEEVIEEAEPASEEPVEEAPAPPVVEEETEEAEEVSPLQVAPGISQENLVYENGRLSLINQTPGTNIAVALPNGTVLTHTVPYHGTWTPNQTISTRKMYSGDVLEFFTFSGTVVDESIFLTVPSGGETRPEDQQNIRYGRQAFGFIPTLRDSRVTYGTQPFFDVEITFPNRVKARATANSLGNTSFSFSDYNYTPRPGDVFTARVFDRSGQEVDLSSTELFQNPSLNQTRTAIPGERVPDIYSVTINPNGGTMNEDFVTTEVDEGEIYSLPYIFQSDLQNPGYTLTGYSVEGTLLNADGEEVTEIPAFGRDYTPMSDVTLTANWEVTSGKFIVLLYDDAPATQRDRYTLTLTAEDGTEFALTSRSFGPGHRTWEVSDIPNGSYTLTIDGYNMSDFERFGQSNQGTFTINADGTASVELVFSDNSPTTFTRYRIYGEPVPETNTVTIDPNGGTISEDYRVTEVVEGETYTVPYTFQSDLARPGYTLTGYTVEGTLLDRNGNPVTEISRFTGDYTPQSDVTLTANWEVTAGKFTVQLYDDMPSTQPERYTVKLVADDGAEYLLSSRSYNADRRVWEVENVPNGYYTLMIEGFNIASGDKFGQPDTTSAFVVNDDGTASVELEFVDDKSTTFIRYQVYGEPVPTSNTVTIDPNGGTINEDYRVTEVEAGETYTVPYIFQSDLARPGYTLTGYTVEGTLLDRNGNPVTEISRFTGDYTPETDVTLTANWEVTSGRFIIQDTIPNFIVDTRTFALTDGENTYPMTSRSYTNLYREWRVDNIPNGTYTLIVDGIEYPEEWTFEKVGHPDTESDVSFENGLPTFDLAFEDDSSTTFIRYRLSMNQYDLGIEVRDVNNRRTADVGILVEDEEGTVFEGTYDQYNLWTTNTSLPVGDYTITLTTPERTVAEINDTVASQTAVATDEENVFTIRVNAENRGNLSRVFGAFRLVEVPATYPLGVEVRGLDGRRTSDVGIRVTNEDGVVFEGTYDQYNLWTSTEQLLEGTYTITLTTPEGTVAEINDTVASQKAVATDIENVFTIEVNEATQGNLSRIFGAFRLVEVPATYPLGVEVRGLDGRRTSDVGVRVTNEDGVVFEGTYDQYNLWTSTEQLLEGTYTITLTTPEGTVAEINDTVASQRAVATDTENVFTIEVNETSQGNLTRVFGAFRLVEIEEPAPETDADRYEPIFVDEIVLDLNRGNGQLKNPKTLIQNMNEMPGGIKVEYTNLDQVDFSGKTTETQTVEITVTYRDGSTDVAEVPLRVIPKETPQRPGQGVIGKVIKTVVKVVKTVVNIISKLFRGWF